MKVAIVHENDCGAELDDRDWFDVKDDQDSRGIRRRLVEFVRTTEVYAGDTIRVVQQEVG